MKNVNKIRMRETIVSYCFLAPVLIFFVVFVLVPMIMGFVTSFFNYTMIDFTFVGIDNYVRMFNDEVFRKSLVNTLINARPASQFHRQRLSALQSPAVHLRCAASQTHFVQHSPLCPTPPALPQSKPHNPSRPDRYLSTRLL